jgi:hypothetical protein
MHYVMPEGRQRREERQVERRLAPLRGVHVLREGLPVPGDAGLQHLEGNRLDVDEVAHCHLARLRLARRDADAAVAHHHRRHAVPARGRGRAIPADLRVVVRVRVDEAGSDNQAGGIDNTVGFVGDFFLNGNDLSIQNPDIHAFGRRAGAVHHRAVANQEVQSHGQII